MALFRLALIATVAALQYVACRPEPFYLLIQTGASDALIA